MCMCVVAVQKDGLTVARSQIERRKKTKQELMSQFDVGRKEGEGERGGFKACESGGEERGK